MSHSISFHPKQLLPSALLLATIAGGASLLLYAVYTYSAPILAAHQQEKLLSQLNTIIASEHYDNALAEDKIHLSVPELDAKKPITLYRARKHQQPVACLLLVTAPNGYSGDIHLLVGVWADGRIAGVRVLSHKETPGLGDYIEDTRSSWVHQFVDKSLSNPSLERWKVKKDGGVFSYHTGATITPRAITSTLAKTLTWVQTHQQDIYAFP